MDTILYAPTSAERPARTVTLFVPPDWDNYIWRAFRLLTDRLVTAAAWITPKSVPPLLLPVTAAVWLSCLRVLLALALLDPAALPPPPTQQP